MKLRITKLNKTIINDEENDEVIKHKATLTDMDNESDAKVTITQTEELDTEIGDLYELVKKQSQSHLEDNHIDKKN